MNDFSVLLDKRQSNHTPKKFLCPNCGQKTFVKYYDFERQEYLPDDFGKCDRESNCGYWQKPNKEYFKSFHSPNFCVPKKINTIPPKKIIPPDFIDTDLVNTSFENNHIETNHFIHFLEKRFGAEIALHLVNYYHIGRSDYQFWRKEFPQYKSPKGATIFWQIDKDENIRSGKIMLYNKEGKRVKEPFNHVTWVHSVLKLPNFNLVQCFFGEHLLNENLYPENRGKTIAILESAKTAIIAHACLQDMNLLWLSAEGSEGLNREKCKVLAGREVILFPDLDKSDKNYEKWAAKAREMQRNLDVAVSVNNLLREVANEEERTKGCDLADYLLR